MIGIGAKQQNSPVWRALLKFIYYIFPNLEHFNIRAQVVYGISIPEGYIMNALYGLLYTILLLSLSILFFPGKTYDPLGYIDNSFCFIDRRDMLHAKETDLYHRAILESGEHDLSSGPEQD